MNLYIINNTVYPNIYDYWENNPNDWFSHKVLTQNFIEYLTKEEKELETKEDYISLLLQYDQILRHPIEDDLERLKYLSNQKEYMEYCLNIANILIEKYWDLLKPWEKVFTLLTLRHSENLENKLKSLDMINNELKNDLNNNLYLRFLKATVLELDNYYSKEFSTNYVNIENIHNFSNYHELIDKKCKYSDNILNYKEYVDEYFDFSKQFIKIINNALHIDKIAISISGGVDSMLLSLFVKQYIERHKLDINLILIHICYNNRDETTQEIEFLKTWAKTLNLKLYVRNIFELKRHRDCSYRQLYEDVTRKIRFNFYKQFNCPILLGHNLDDCLENVFSNLSKKIHFENLKGMDIISYDNENILIGRPLLYIKKDNIYKVAEFYGIPYLYDSTPPWSQRGKMRDVLLPSINNFNPNILDGISYFSDTTKFLFQEWEESFKIWAKNINVDKNKIIINDDFYKRNKDKLMFWTKLWFYLDLDNKPTNKSFQNLISFLNKNKGNIILSKNYTIKWDEQYVKIVNTIKE
jgi:tRNA(Ile)-lysidine synthetase-like protein